MGSVIFPDAHLKIYLDANVEIRAKRRILQLQSNNQHVNLDQMIKYISSRDQRDSNRSQSPLRKLSDNIIIDTSYLTVQQVIDKIVDIYHKGADK